MAFGGGKFEVGDEVVSVATKSGRIVPTRARIVGTATSGSPHYLLDDGSRKRAREMTPLPTMVAEVAEAAMLRSLGGGPTRIEDLEGGRDLILFRVASIWERLEPHERGEAVLAEEADIVVAGVLSGMDARRFEDRLLALGDHVVERADGATAGWAVVHDGTIVARRADEAGARRIALERVVADAKSRLGIEHGEWARLAPGDKLASVERAFEAPSFAP